MRTVKQTLQNNRDSKARHRRKSIIKMVKELNSKEIEAVVPLILKDNYSIDKTYNAIRSQWSDFRLKKRITDREKYREQQNKINKERYKKDPDYKRRMLDRVEKQYKERKKILERTTKIEKNLLRVIKALELTQDENYSSITNLVLSYLTDIRDNRVPEKLITDKIKLKSEVETCEYSSGTNVLIVSLEVRIWNYF